MDTITVVETHSYFTVA